MFSTQSYNCIPIFHIFDIIPLFAIELEEPKIGILGKGLNYEAHVKVHLFDTHLLVLSSRSSAKVKVKYEGHILKKIAYLGKLLFHKDCFRLLVSLFSFLCRMSWSMKLRDLKMIRKCM